MRRKIFITYYNLIKKSKTDLKKKNGKIERVLRRYRKQIFYIINYVPLSFTIIYNLWLIIQLFLRGQGDLAIIQILAFGGILLSCFIAFLNTVLLDLKESKE